MPCNFQQDFFPLSFSFSCEIPLHQLIQSWITLSNSLPPLLRALCFWEAPRKNLFYLGQKAQTCGPTHLPRRFWEIRDLELAIWEKFGLLT